MPDYSAFHEPHHAVNLPLALDGVINVSEILLPAITMLCGKDANANLPSIGTVIGVCPDCQVYGLAPDRWLAVYSVAPDSLNEFACSTVFATDHSHAWAVLRVSGDKALEALQCLCPVDIHPSSFVHGTCFQSRLGKNPALVSHAAGTRSFGSFDIFIPRSSARAMLEDIYDAAIRL